MPAGSLLHLRFAAGNVDPEEWECPYDPRLDRKAVTRHLAFSAGPRVCPGAGISRLEQTIAWNRLLDRLGSLTYAPGNTFEHQPGMNLDIGRLRGEALAIRRLVTYGAIIMAVGGALAAHYIMEILEEAGLPPGVINFVPGRGRASKSTVALPWSSGP